MDANESSDQNTGLSHRACRDIFYATKQSSRGFLPALLPGQTVSAAVVTMRISFLFAAPRPG